MAKTKEQLLETGQKLSEAGKKGMAKRNARRYDIIKELTKYYPKTMLDWFTEKWTTDQLAELLKGKLSNAHEKLSQD